jgi:hypothetical protein
MVHLGHHVMDISQLASQISSKFGLPHAGHQK